MVYFIYMYVNKHVELAQRYGKFLYYYLSDWCLL